MLGQSSPIIHNPMKKIAIFGIVILFILAICEVGAAAQLGLSVHPAEADLLTATILKAATTSAAFSVTTSTRILATTTSVSAPSYTRVYATICNPNSNPVVLNMNSDRPASLSSMTYVIAAAAGYSACYEITDRNMYQGSIQASSTNQTATTISVSDYVSR